MDMKKLAKEFKTLNKEFIEAHKDDKILLNYEWQCYCDMLCKNGEITQRQWQNLKSIF